MLNLRKPGGSERRPVVAREDGDVRTEQPSRAGGTKDDVSVEDARRFEVVQAVGRSIERYLSRVKDEESGRRGGSGKGQDARGIQAVHSNIIQILVNEGHSTTGVSLGQVSEVLRDYFKQVDGRWYLLGEEVRSANARYDTLGGDATTARWAADFTAPADEASTIEWIRALIRLKGPQLEGDLTDRYRLAAPALTLSKGFRRILEENFTYDGRRGRWRLLTGAEADAKLSVKVRLLERKVTEILEGISPAPDAEGMGLLLEDCYSDGLYQQAYELWNRISPGEPTPERYRTLTRKARVSRLRAQSGAPRS